MRRVKCDLKAVKMTSQWVMFIGIYHGIECNMFDQGTIISAGRDECEFVSMWHERDSDKYQFWEYGFLNIGG